MAFAEGYCESHKRWFSKGWQCSYCEREEAEAQAYWEQRNRTSAAAWSKYLLGHLDCGHLKSDVLTINNKSLTVEDVQDIIWSLEHA